MVEEPGPLSDPELARARREKRMRRKVNRHAAHDMYAYIHGADAPFPPSNHKPKPAPSPRLAAASLAASSERSSSLWTVTGMSTLYKSFLLKAPCLSNRPTLLNNVSSRIQLAREMGKSWPFGLGWAPLHLSQSQMGSIEENNKLGYYFNVSVWCLCFSVYLKTESKGVLKTTYLNKRRSFTQYGIGAAFYI